MISRRQPVKNPPSKNNPLSEKARAYAFLLLKFRLRSESELYKRLKQKGFSEEISRETVGFLKEKEFIDDRIFTKNWLDSRLKRPFGWRRIRQELALKGIDKEIIDNAIGRAKSSYNEAEAAGRLARQKFLKQTGIEPQKAKARVFSFLMRRGFSPETASDIIRQL